VSGLADEIAAAKARANHTGTQSTATITGLDAALAGKAAAVHTHETSSVNGLDAALAGKAASAHTHEISGVNGLSSALAGKVPAPMVRTTAQGPPSAAVPAVAYLAILGASSGKTITIGGRIYTMLYPDNGAASALFSDAASLVACINGLRAGVSADALVSAEEYVGGYPGMIKLTARAAGAAGNDIEISRGSGTTGLFLMGPDPGVGTSNPISMDGGVSGVVPSAPGQVCYTGDAAPYRVDIGLPDGSWMHIPDASKVMGI
jgi:hypothetical protein